MKLNIDLTRVQAKMLLKLAHQPGRTVTEVSLRAKLYQAAQDILRASRVHTLPKEVRKNKS